MCPLLTAVIIPEKLPPEQLEWAKKRNFEIRPLSHEKLREFIPSRNGAAPSFWSFERGIEPRTS